MNARKQYISLHSVIGMRMGTLLPYSHRRVRQPAEKLPSHLLRLLLTVEEEPHPAMASVITRHR